MSKWPFITKLLQYIGRQEYIRFGLRDRLIRLFHNPDVYFNKPFELSFYGKKYSGNFDTFIDWCVYYFGAYSKSELKLFQDFVPLSNKNPIFIDIGANIGHHTLLSPRLHTMFTLLNHFHLYPKKYPKKFRIMILKMFFYIRLG